jgi:hypothetical protein
MGLQRDQAITIAALRVLRGFVVDLTSIRPLGTCPPYEPSAKGSGPQADFGRRVGFIARFSPAG